MEAVWAHEARQVLDGSPSFHAMREWLTACKGEFALLAAREKKDDSRRITLAIRNMADVCGLLYSSDICRGLQINLGLCDSEHLACTDNRAAPADDRSTLADDGRTKRPPRGRKYDRSALADDGSTPAGNRVIYIFNRRCGFHKARLGGTHERKRREATQIHRLGNLHCSVGPREED